MVREVMEGKELRQYVDGELPIPTEAELRREREEKAATGTDEATPGPSIISSTAGDGNGSPVSREAPVRPDL
jgi:hypothetical protein